MSSKKEVRKRVQEIYRRRVENYDITANLYYLIGYPEWRYRRLTIDRLELKKGDRVVEIGCGTGLNLGLVQERVGPEGEIAGVDLTQAMLAQAMRQTLGDPQIEYRYLDITYLMSGQPAR